MKQFECNNCGHVPASDFPVENASKAKEPCEECGAEDWINAEQD